jgi:electron transfer flavoprotein alpha subunit
MTILILAEHDNAALKTSTLNAVTAASELGGDVVVLVVGHQCRGVADAAGRIAGVSKVILADASHLADQLPENVTAQVLSVAGGYSHILAPATSFGKAVLPRVAAALDVAQASDILSIESADTFKRAIYAGSVIATVQLTDPVKVITVRTTAFEAAAPEGGAASVETMPVVPDANKSTFLSRDIAKLDRPELASAQIVVSGGRGMGSVQNFALLERLADKLNAAMGASRAAVDAGYAPNDWQVGQTGKIVAPKLYIAVGISGAIQHLAGMKDSDVIVAINKDPEAPIFGVADYGLVGDLFDIVPDFTAAI